MPPPQYFVNLGIVYLVTEVIMANTEDNKNKIKKLAFEGTNLPLYQI
jgi:hypothetical protein